MWMSREVLFHRWRRACRRCPADYLFAFYIHLLRCSTTLYLVVTTTLLHAPTWFLILYSSFLPGNNTSSQEVWCSLYCLFVCLFSLSLSLSTHTSLSFFVYYTGSFHIIYLRIFLMEWLSIQKAMAITFKSRVAPSIPVNTTPTASSSVTITIFPQFFCFICGNPLPSIHSSCRGLCGDTQTNRLRGRWLGTLPNIYTQTTRLWCVVPEIRFPHSLRRAAARLSPPRRRKIICCRVS